MPPAGMPKPKYANKAVEIDGIRWSSKMEARYYAHLKTLRAAGVLRNFHRQVIVDLGAGVKHLVDFLLIYQHEHQEDYVEIKGFDTPHGRTKRRLAEEKLGREIIVLTRKDIDQICPKDPK